MGMAHARTLAEGKAKRAKLAAVCSSDAEKRAQFPQCRGFSDFAELIRSGAIDALVIATPHPLHAEAGIAALNAGLHVMVEKPIASTLQQARQLLAARNSAQVMAVMFNMRTRPYLRRAREMLLAGEFGAVQRVTWTATAFYRPETYYAESKWRGTWKGEGGGVLLNQAPHHLDLMQWFLGMPVRVRGFCSFGRYHSIEVEDEATAYCEFDNGASATFTTSTGESPGSTRVEIAAAFGKLIIDQEKATFTRNEIQPAAPSGAKPSSAMIALPPGTTTQIDASTHAGNYSEMFSNFCDAILDGAPLIAPAEEGLRSLELANAILLSSLQQRTIDLPLDAQQYEAAITGLIQKNR
jgi:predicted dehydrogenase